MQKQNYTLVAISKPAQAAKHPGTKVVYENFKVYSSQTVKPNIKMKLQVRGIFFFFCILGQQMSRADLILILNKALQKVGEKIST